MKRILIVLSVLLAVSLSADARKIRGTVRGEGEALSGVIVTDGVHFTVTDARGAYKLNVAKDARFVSVVTPSGYTADFSSGTVEFYRELTKEKVYDFTLRPVAPVSDYTIFSVSDPQMKPQHVSQFLAEPLQDLIARAKEYSAKNPTVIIALGDIAWNILDIYPDYKAAMARTGVPCYAVIGNHDHNQDRAGKAAVEGYESAFGPVNYAFFLGNDLVIGLDNLLFTGGTDDPTKSGKYREGYSEETLAFVRNLLSYVPKETHLFIAQHSPLYRWFNDKHPDVVNGQEMLDILEGRQVDFLCGHTHIQNNLIYSDDIIEHNAASICGAWWSTKVCNDGTPRGYEIFNNNRGVLSWYWHNIDFPDDYQVEFIDPGQSTRHPNSLVANVWDYDPSWSVSWTQDGVEMGELYETLDVSPTYIREIQGVYPNTISSYKRPRLNLHYFAATPSQYARTVGIKVVNPAGKTWKYEFDMRNYVDIQGHRGGAGLMPENTVPAMINAIRLGENTLEMDLQISKDRQVVVSHENYFHPRYSMRPDSSLVQQDDPKTYLYHLDYEDIAKWDVGLRPNELWPTQANVPAVKPLASELIDIVEQYTAEHGFSPVRYNIEIKSTTRKDEGTYCPVYTEFVDLCIPLLESKDLGDRLVIQSFDLRALNYMHEKYPSIFLSYLTSKESSVETLLDKLGFIPDWWSPNYHDVTAENVAYCHEHGIKVVPWTVDEPEDIARMISYGVDAIISNYPDRIMKQTRGYTTVQFSREDL
ncbi:MAG: calcineurin-like phosphoesterase C-terminal domain-containing protein [Bacteroidales bacterium]|nr:calcineurin-like phosphoesterase C-terminal domain-containing protein [Bacteroidales bacterium]